MSDHPPIEQQVTFFYTHELDASAEFYQYKERGVEFEKPHTVNENYNIYHCFLLNPSGYLVEIQHFEINP
ncbi:hypothetical protein [Nostoc sp.]|uniref:hypothetical protein n=1 Tax=Nostoc sp. TaxID=1180 RepID=UPI003593BB35